MPTRIYNDVEDDNVGVNTNYSRVDHNRDETRYNRVHTRYLTNLARGKSVYFYINGDTNFPSRKVLYNPKQFRDLSNYMDYLTEKLDPRFGAVRKICTPVHGHQVLDLNELQENGNFVAVGNDSFRPYRYDQITGDRRRQQPFNYNVDPAHHNRQYLSSGKIKKCDTQSLLIKVWPNGGDLQGPRRVLISPRIRPYTLPSVIAHVNELLKEDCLGTVEKISGLPAGSLETFAPAQRVSCRRLYFLTGAQVSDVDQIIQNGQYVACRKTEKFKRARYNEQAVRNLAMSPRLDRKLLPPLPPRSINSTSQSSPEHSNASTQNSVHSNPHRRKAPNGLGDDRVFPSKPVKYVRSPEKARMFEGDQDQSGLYRAKQNNRNTRGAREVPDSRHTKTVLPVDHWDAQEVDEDYMQDKNKKKSLTKTQPGTHNSKTQKPVAAAERQMSATNGQKRRFSSDSMDEENKAAAKIQAGYRGHQTRQQINSFPGRNERNGEGKPNAGNIQSGFTKSQLQKPPTTDSKQNPGKQATVKNQGKYYEQPLGKHPGTDLKQTQVEHEKAAEKIQASFRGYQTRKRVNEEKEAATKIQAGFRGYQDRKTSPPLSGKSPHTNNRKSRTKDEKSSIKNGMSTNKDGYSGIRDGKSNIKDEKSHIKDDKSHIKDGKSHIEGKVNSKDGKLSTKDDVDFKTKPAVKEEKNHKKRQPPVREDTYDELDKENDAAITIQSHFRGYRTRQELASQRGAM